MYARITVLSYDEKTQKCYCNLGYGSRKSPQSLTDQKNLKLPHQPPYVTFQDSVCKRWFIICTMFTKQNTVLWLKWKLCFNKMTSVAALQLGYSCCLWKTSFWLITDVFLGCQLQTPSRKNSFLMVSCCK